MKSIKSILKVFEVLTFILIITSCEEFLKEEPKTQLTTDAYFRNLQDARATINTLYWSGAITFFQSGTYFTNGSWEMESGFMTGFFTTDRPEGKGPWESQNLSMTAENMNDVMPSVWSTAYQGIARANNAIKYLPTVPDVSEADLNRMLGEARFWRAYNYFWMVKFFGDIPIVTEPYETLDNIFVPRDPDEDVYNLIISDLEWTLNNAGLPDVPYYLNGFKVTKGLVATLLADVYLQNAGYPVQGTGSYAKAATAARTVINSGVYKLIQNGSTPELSAYNVMRTSEKELEYIYAVEYHPDLKATPKPQYTIPNQMRPPGTKYQDMWDCYHPRDEFMNIYDPALDLRIQNRQLWYNSIERGGITYNFNQWAPYLWYDEQAIFSTGKGGQDITVYRYAEILLIAAEAIAQSEGVTNEAITYLADVRSRAYWQTDRNEIISELQGLSKDQFIEEVWKERHRELPFDFATWPDIQRTRKYPVTLQANPGEVTFGDLIGHQNPFGATFQEYHLLWPIPVTVLQKNPELLQNPGY